MPEVSVRAAVTVALLLKDTPVEVLEMVKLLNVSPPARAVVIDCAAPPSKITVPDLSTNGLALRVFVTDQLPAKLTEN